MILNQTLWLGSSPEGAVTLLPQMANRHGLIAGATGTGKTVSLQVLAEGFSKLGVPVFLADVKGDLAGLCKPGQLNEKIESRLHKCGAAQAGFTPQANPVVFWDVYGEKGHPVRCTVSEMGPLRRRPAADRSEGSARRAFLRRGKRREVYPGIRQHH